VSDERASGVFTQTLTADVDGQRRQVLDAHRASEALSKPKGPAPLIDAQSLTTDGLAPPEQPSQRKMRIFAASQAATERPKPETEAAAPRAGEEAVKGPPATEIPASEHTRVRVLAEYGMTLPEIAKLYGVSLNEVKRIVRT
jgi:hypothetical protein